MFLMKMDWNPSNCETTELCLQAPNIAFTIYGLEKWSEALNKSMLGLPECASTIANASAEIANEQLGLLNCAFISSAVRLGETNTGLWNDAWDGAGACTGLYAADFFRLMANSYNRYNPNAILPELRNLAPTSINKVTLLSQLNSAYGKQIWVECKPNTNNLYIIVVCLSTNPPYDIIDCPGTPTEAGEPGECLDIIYLPTVSGIAPAATDVPVECQPYVLKSLPLTSPLPEPILVPDGKDNILSPSPSALPPPAPAATTDGSEDSSSSSTDLGPIIGGVVGGIVLAGAIVAGILFLRRKPRSNTLVESPLPVPNSYYAPAAPQVYYNESGSGGAGGATPDPMLFATSPPYEISNAQGTRQIPSDSPWLPSAPPALNLPVYVAGAGGGGAVAAGAYGGSDSPPVTPSSNVTSISAQPSSVVGVDPLLQYINSTISNTSGGSRGPLAAWQLRFDDIVITTPIGEGSWGRVYKGNWNQTQVAVKILLDAAGGSEISASESLMAANSPVMARLEKEASLMTQLHHPNVVQFLGITVYPAAVVTEFCSKGSLITVLQSSGAFPERAAELTWSRRMGMAADCVRGMLYLHIRNPPIVHRDLKSANLLVTGGWVVKVSDFNLSKIMQESTRSTSLQAMNPRWLAPEVLNGEIASLQSDVYAFGVILWELLTWQLPWGTSNPWGIVGQITSGRRPQVPAPAELPGPNSGAWPQLQRYIELMNKCWAQEPSARPTFQQIMVELQEIDPVATQQE